MIATAVFLTNPEGVPYSSGAVIGQPMRIICPERPGSFLELSLLGVTFAGEAQTAGSMRLHLYCGEPVPIEDGQPFNLRAEDREKHLTWLDVPAPAQLGDTWKSQDSSQRFRVEVPACGTLRAVLEATTGLQCAGAVGIEARLIGV